MTTNEWFDHIASLTIKWVGSLTALLISIGITIIWALSGPLFNYSDTWQLVANTATTIVTFWMVFLIQYSQNKDTAAVQAKLDELIRSIKEARNEFIGLDHKTAQEIEKVRDDGIRN